MRLDTVAAEIGAAEEGFQRAVGQLMGPDGGPLYAAAEHQRRLEAARAGPLRDLDTIQRRLEAEAERQRRQVALLDGDVLDELSGEDLARASTLLPLATSDAGILPLDALQARGRAALESGDRPRCVVWARAITERLARELDQDAGRPVHMTAAGLGGIVRHMDGGRAALLNELGRLASALQQAADPGREQRKEAAETRLREIHKLLGKLRLTRNRIDGSEDARLLEMRQSVMYRM